MESYVYFSYEQVLKGYLADLTFWEFFGSTWLLSVLLGPSAHVFADKPSMIKETPIGIRSSPQLLRKCSRFSA